MVAQTVGAVEYTHCITATSVLDMTLNNPVRPRNAGALGKCGEYHHCYCPQVYLRESIYGSNRTV